LRTAGVKTA
jgi:leucyl aminopeptidase